jgi:heme exporter protein D
MDSGPSMRWRVESGDVPEAIHDRVSRVVNAEAEPLAKPLFRPTSRSATLFPLVVLVAILPGLVALNAWDLTPPGPLWGLRGLAVLDGLALDQTPLAATIKPIQESAAYGVVAFQPPLYAWLEAMGFWLSDECDPLASVLPSFVSGALCVVLVYLHGRLWRGPGLGFTAALLVGFNQNLLLRIQEATPSTLALCGVLATMLAYGWHQRVTNESTRPWPWASPAVWGALGGLALGLTLLTLGGVGLLVVPIVVLHQYYLRGAATQSSRQARIRDWLKNWRDNPVLAGGMLSLTIALAVAVPWFVFMFSVHSWEALTTLTLPPDALLADRWSSLLPRLVDLAPVTLPLGLFGAVWVIRSALVDEPDTREAIGGSLWVIWLAVACLAPAVWPNGPRSAFELNILVPLSLLAAQMLADLVNRRVSIKVLIALAPATAMSIAWWASAALNEAVGDLVTGQADAATALGLHLAMDLVIASVFVGRALYRWAWRRDDRQRGILAAFLLIVLALTAVDGLREVVFRHGSTHDLLALRTMILRRNRETPFQTVVVVSPPPQPPNAHNGGSTTQEPSRGGRLRFILRTALPGLYQHDLDSIDELFKLPECQRLVIFAGTDQCLSSADQAKLGLEAIHPGRSGILAAYATARSRTTRK